MGSGAGAADDAAATGEPVLADPGASAVDILFGDVSGTVQGDWAAAMASAAQHVAAHTVATVSGGARTLVHTQCAPCQRPGLGSAAQHA